MKKEGNMRDPKRIDKMMLMLKELWKSQPDVRFGQLIDNFFNYVKSKTDKDIFYIEDEIMTSFLVEYFLQENK